MVNLEQNKLLTLWRVLFTEKGYSWQQLRSFTTNNGDKNTIALLAYFEPFVPTFYGNQKRKIIDSEAYLSIFKKQAPTPALFKSRLYNTVSDLYDLTERFVLAKAAESDPLSPPYQVLLQLYTHQNLHEHFLDYWRILQKRQAAMPLTERSVFEAFYLAEIFTQFQLMTNRKEAAAAMHTVDDALHSLLLTNILRYSVSIKALQEQLNERFKNPFLATSLTYIKENLAWAKRYPMLYVYYLVYNLLDNPTKNDLKIGLVALKRYQHLFSEPELRMLYLNAENISAFLINQNTSDLESYQLAFMIFNQQIEGNVFSNTDNSVSTIRFLNYITVALRCKEHKKANNFIAEYQANLQESHRGDNVRYATALVQFEEGNFQGVIDGLRFKRFNEEDSMLRSQIVFLKAWFELEEQNHHKAGRHTEFDTLKRVIEFEKMIKSTQSLAESLQQSFLLVATAFRQIIQLTDNHRKGYAPQTAKEELKNWLNAPPKLVERVWFLKKCELL